MEKEYTCQQAAASLGVSLSAIRRWVKAEKGALSILKKSGGLLCERKRIRFQFIREKKKTYPGRLLCRVMKVSHSAFYEWKRKSPQVASPAMMALERTTVRIFNEHKQTLGSRRLKLKLNLAGFQVGRFKTRRLMASLSLIARYPKRYRVTTDSQHNHTIAPNLLDWQFTVNTPNKVWTTDITYIRTYQG